MVFSLAEDTLLTGFDCCLAGRGSLVHSSASPEVQDTDGSPVSPIGRA